jgi:predicted SnoaL-like aldol condensation-catalyzing enzyme
MTESKEERNKALVLKAFDTLFNKRDYKAAESFWSPKYIQHSAHIEPGREGLMNLIKSLPPTLKYEAGAIVADGDFVIVHGRFSGMGQPRNWIAADVVRIENGVLAEHWDVIEDEVGQSDSQSGLPMFGNSFPT